MNRRPLACSWLFIAIFVYLLVLFAILPQIWKQNANQRHNTPRQSVDIVYNTPDADYPVFASSTAEESIDSPTHFSSLSQAAIAEPSAAILSEVSVYPVLVDEGTNSLSSTLSTAELALAEEEKTPLEEEKAQPAEAKTPSEKEKSSREESVDGSSGKSELSSVAQSAEEQSPTIAEKSRFAKAAPTLVAHLPKTTNMPTESVKPASPDLHYPNTGLEPLTPPAPPDLENYHIKTNKLKSWTAPTALLSMLDELSKAKHSSGWADETAQLVRDLGPAIAGDSDEAASILDRLEKSHVEAIRLADSSSDWPLARKLRQASYAIERRLDVWREVVRLGASSLVEAELPKADSKRLSMCLAEMDRVMKTSPEGQYWRKYMLVDALQDLSSQQHETEVDQQRKVAQKALARLTQTPMSTRQRQFVASKPVAAFCAELRHWAAEPLTSAEVLRDIERYEQTRLPSDAQRLADDLRSLGQSSDPKRRELARSVESHYRNANIRASFTEDFLNRLVPQQNMELAAVHDTVMGLPVRGQSLTSTDVALRLVPDPTHVRMALEVTGEVAAMTSATSGPATFYNDSDSLYAARKPLEIDEKGFKLMPAEVDVRHETRLRDVATDFDGIPLLGPMARMVARSQHEMARPQANQEARIKVANRARQRIDSEAHDRLTEMVNNLNRNVFGPLVNMALEPTMVEAQTTEQRMTMRLRIAGEDQLGSYTPRPQAPEKSLASFQINESMLNNALQRLQLEGRTFTLPQLVQRISERFQRPNTWPVNPDYEDLTVTFAKKDAVTVRCQEGQAILTLNITELSKEPRQWENFQVRVFYRPQVNGRSAELVRDGAIHLIGQRLNNNAQIALRGIFAKAFPRSETIRLTPERLLIDPKLQDLAITQFVVDDGWIGFAVGPKQFAMQTTQLPSARK